MADKNGGPGTGQPGRDIEILYEDNHLLGVVKPVNIPVQEDATGDLDLLTLLKEDIKQRYDKPGNVFMGLVHRLDRPVGGAMIFAKTSKAASRLSESVRSRSFRKVYLTVVHGTLPAPSGRLRNFLLKNAKTNTVSVVRQGTQDAKEAVLDYTVLGTAEGFSLVKINLLTGRSHQIRVQLAHAGCPLYGDQKYGPSVNKPGQQIALWSSIVGFPHPVTKEEMDLVSLPPRSHPWSLWSRDIQERSLAQAFDET
ncbi:RNA pseudouridine synthase [Paenibacillus sp. HN-1]|uniref:RluA family pseudouridine synthase n=1 Tax=Paenibacillus TaxID=44249 RepID=UPI001CA87D7E|nr:MULTISPECIES: RNA pseudouridine synthase [Paenibacillus]MBY9081724.1 RNA pseudouridine synthase [Paenibacillus sp. CGMCC 1.18879]MBY9083593.1 RNA pseudouridine synthase [Paenibacillus sinensis]